MSTETYRNIIIGSGEGGKYLAWHLASLGEPTVVIERRWIGGSCPNTNCLPTKNEIWSAKVADLTRRHTEFGVLGSAVDVDMAGVLKRKRDMVAGLVAMHLEKYEASGAELVMGEARFRGPKAVHVRLNDGGERSLSAERIFLNLGTSPSLPPTPGLREAVPLTNITLLELDRLPSHLIVIGGGYVGLEFAQAYRRLGSKVTVLQRASALLPKEDKDVSDEVQRLLTNEGIEVITSAHLTCVSGRSGDQVTVALNDPSDGRTISGTDLLVATGRTPNTSGIGLDLAGVEVDEGGWIRVNERLETSCPGIWAIGECAGSPQFTHASLDDFRIIRDNLAGGRRSTQDRLMPFCLYTDPQVARVGLSEAEAEERGVAFQVLRAPMKAVLRTRTISETNGFAKALISPENGRILGFTMIGPDAGEVMTAVQIAMYAGLPYTALADCVIAHPTMTEAINVVFSSAMGRKRRAAV